MEPAKAFPSAYIGLDIGGTLSKICFLLSPEDQVVTHLSSQNFTIGGKKRIVYFNMFSLPEECFAFIRSHFAHFQIAVTGGGGFKYKAELEALHPNIRNINQFESLVEGLHCLAEQKNPVKTLEVRPDLEVTTTHRFIEEMFPYMLVNIGSGASMLHIKQNYEFERIGGTSLGGGFFMGLNKVLIGEDSFQKTMKLIREGQEENQEFDLSSSKSALAKQIHDLTFQNICQLAILNSKNHEIENIIFTGSFTRQNDFLVDCFVKAMREHYRVNTPSLRRFISLESKDGYLGAIGTLCCLTK